MANATSPGSQMVAVPVWIHLTVCVPSSSPSITVPTSPPARERGASSLEVLLNDRACRNHSGLHLLHPFAWPSGIARVRATLSGARRWAHQGSDGRCGATSRCSSTSLHLKRSPPPHRDHSKARPLPYPNARTEHTFSYASHQARVAGHPTWEGVPAAQHARPSGAAHGVLPQGPARQGRLGEVPVAVEHRHGARVALHPPDSSVRERLPKAPSPLALSGVRSLNAQRERDVHPHHVSGRMAGDVPLWRGLGARGRCLGGRRRRVRQPDPEEESALSLAGMGADS